jgi:hypothetical protein
MVLVPDFYAEVEVGFRDRVYGSLFERRLMTTWLERLRDAARIEAYSSHGCVVVKYILGSLGFLFCARQEVSQEELELFDAMNLNIDAYKASLGKQGRGRKGMRGVKRGGRGSARGVLLSVGRRPRA